MSNIPHYTRLKRVLRYHLPVGTIPKCETKVGVLITQCVPKLDMPFLGITLMCVLWYWLHMLLPLKRDAKNGVK